MAKPHQRVFALIAALLFLGTSVALSAIVVWQIHQQNQAEKTKSTDSTNESKTSESTKPKEGQLQGTKLANFTPTDSVPALQKIDLKEGNGDVVNPGDTVTAHYTGAIAKTGIIFQSSHDGPNQPIPFSLSGVIKGWTDGVPGMKVGGIRRLLIPATEAYGANPPQGSGIPANADLVFDIEIVKIGQ
ncbi:MAG TPA: FKBP-type peptidyl-prolyl cis-trans isomerase [Candidatus Limnocylindrales bacterium]|nr:FKBP-type peptidyl-prolyl cis-trans isomerase [Candidatus Limnocylindrales bacterium]